MKRTAVGLLIVVTLLFSLAASAIAADYRLGPGDVISISVYGVEEFKDKDNQLTVRPDGKVAFPLAGELTVTDLTVSELASELTRSLGQYLKNPQVTVNVIKFRTTRVYVLGEVSKPGMYEIEKQHNLLDALGLAGGYTRAAVLTKIYVVRKATGSYEEIDLTKLLKKADLSQNVALNEGDVVYINRNGISFVSDVLPLITAIYQIRHF